MIYDFTLNGYTVKFYETTEFRSFGIFDTNDKIVEAQTRYHCQHEGAFPFYMLAEDATEWIEDITFP